MSVIKNKWALVTGASRGVGRQVVMALAEKGCNLVLQSRKTEHTSNLATELKSKGIRVEQLSAELSDITATIEMAKTAEKISGGIDILYNNAAIMTPWRDNYFAIPAVDYEKSFTVNVIAPISICDVIIPAMIERGFGRVINITSGIQDQPELQAYSISKAALDKYVKDLAIKLEKSGVLINLLDPGWLRTDLGGDQAPDPVEAVIPGALVPALLDNDSKSGILYCAQDYKN